MLNMNAQMFAKMPLKKQSCKYDTNNILRNDLYNNF